MEYRNFSRSGLNSIDCEINHPTYGWIPFTASLDDTEQYGRVIYAEADKKLPAWVEPPLDLDKLAVEARAKRNSLLTASDWTQVADAPVNKTAWAVYRQELRDIIEQADFPVVIDWPVEP